MYLWRDKHTLEEIQAAAMLLGEPRPLLCSCCGGLQKSKAIFGYRTCPQCDGTGFDYIGRETARYAGLEQSKLCLVLDRKFEYYIGERENFIEAVLRTWREDRFKRKIDRLAIAADCFISAMCVVAICISAYWSVTYG